MFGEMGQWPFKIGAIWCHLVRFSAMGKTGRAKVVDARRDIGRGVLHGMDQRSDQGRPTG